MKKLLALTLALFLLAPSAFAASMSVLPAGRNVNAGDLVTARVSINTSGVAINQAEATLRFPTDVLEVVSVSKSSSIFSLWVEEPTYSNTAGTVSFNGGVPTPGYTGSDGAVVSVTFHAKTAGTASLLLSDAAVRANDGRGTDVLSSWSGATITVTAVTTPAPLPAAPTPTPSPTPTPTPAPIPSDTSATISSLTHPSQDMWYANANPTVRWSLPRGATSVQVIVSSDQDAVPTVTHAASVTERKIENLADGTSYFNLRYRTGSTWSDLYTFRLNIDTAPPEAMTHSFVYDEASRELMIALAASDETSGIASYELTIDKDAPVSLRAEAFAEGTYGYPVDEPGLHTVSLAIIDKAGNRLTIPGSFMVPVSVLDTPLVSFGFFNITLLGALLFMGLISILSLLVAATALWRPHQKPKKAASPVKGRASKEIVRQAFDILRQDLDTNVGVAQKIRDGKPLTAEDEAAGRTMRKNLDDFERYLNEEANLSK